MNLRPSGYEPIDHHYKQRVNFFYCYVYCHLYLFYAGKCRQYITMSKQNQRVRFVDKTKAGESPIISLVTQEKKGKEYHAWQVAYKLGGKRHRKQFKTQSEAESYQHQKALELKGLASDKKAKMTTLTSEQIISAENAIKSLGDSYTLEQAVQFFLSNHKAPDHKITLKDASNLYLEDCEREGTRERTIKQKQSVLLMLTNELENPYTHEVTQNKITKFLRGLRAKNGITTATRKTWNNYRNEINHFFKWAIKNDPSTNRPFTFKNPVEGITIYTSKQVAEQRQAIAITPPEKLVKRLSALRAWKDGALVKYYALAYFAGIRPDGELSKLAKREKELINLETLTIHIPANVSKTKEARQVKISENLAMWLRAYPDHPILPTNHSRLIKRTRQAWRLGHDETRHSFISYHVSLYRSIGDASLQAGNSESIVKKHYLNLRPAEEGEQFFSIVPNTKSGKAVFSELTDNQDSKFRII